MKVLHAADLHLDTAFTGHSEEATAMLKKALASIPDQIVALCKQHDCDLLLLSGDVFDGNATADGIRNLQNALRDVAIPTCITPGNHDFCSPDSPWLTEVWPANVHIFTKPVIESIALPELDCRIYGAGFTSMDCPPLMTDFHAEGKETFHIGVLHGDPMQKNAPYNPITPAQIAASGLQYLALGHLHTRGRFVAGETLCAWPGSAMGRGNDETGERGVYLVTVTDSAQAEFLPLDVPHFYDLEVEVLDTPENTVNSVLPPVGNSDFYRITLVGECEPFSIADLHFPHFPHLQLRDRTSPPTDLWGCIGEDNLEGVFFKLLHEAMEAGNEDAQAAAKLARRILDGREVILP